MDKFKELPFKEGFISLTPNPNDPPIDLSPCLDIDRRHPNYLDLIRDCPMRALPGLSAGRRKPAAVAKPDLIIAAHQSIADNATDIYHAVTIKNIGNGTAAIGDMQSNMSVGIQFWVSMNPLLDGELNIDYAAAGGWRLQPQDLQPGEELDKSYHAGPGVPARAIDYRDFQFVIVQLRCDPGVDSNPNNNLSISPVIVGI